MTPATTDPGITGTTTPSRPPSRVLVVDDEPMVLDVVARYLERDGFLVDQAADERNALRLFHANQPDLVVLDLMLPEVDGMTVMREIRATGDLPVLVLTARGDEVDRVLGLEFGADDYVVKPFSPRELVARVRAVLRRTAPRPPSAELQFDGLAIDTAAREVLVSSTPVDLTAREFDLLAFLAASPRQVFSRSQLLEHVWGSSPDYLDHSTVTVHVRRIRNKIEADPENPHWITTVRGVGYRFDP